MFIYAIVPILILAPRQPTKKSKPKEEKKETSVKKEKETKIENKELV